MLYPRAGEEHELIDLLAVSRIASYRRSAAVQSGLVCAPMHQLLISWLSLSLTLWVTSLVVPGFKVNGVKGGLIVGAIVGVLLWLLSGPLYTIIGIGTLSLGFI